jgi:hypothetical protein
MNLYQSDTAPAEPTERVLDITIVRELRTTLGEPIREERYPVRVRVPIRDAPDWVTLRFKAPDDGTGRPIDFKVPVPVDPELPSAYRARYVATATPDHVGELAAGDEHRYISERHNMRDRRYGQVMGERIAHYKRPAHPVTTYTAEARSVNDAQTFHMRGVPSDDPSEPIEKSAIKRKLPKEQDA